LTPFSNKITSKSIKSILRKFPEVTNLQLSNCSKLTEFDFKEIDKLCPKIEELNISHSLFEIKSEIPTFKHLKKLVCNPKYHQKYINHFKLKNVEILEIEMGNHFILKAINGFPHYFECNDYEISVYDVKKMFQDREGIDKRCLRLIHCGKRLEEDRSLNDYNFGKSSNVLNLILRLKSQSEQFEENFLTEDTAFIHFKEIKTPELIPKLPVYNFPFMDPKSCEKILQNDKTFSKFEITEMIESKVLPKFGISGEFDYDIFFVEYGFEKDNDFVLHTDPSAFTLNICLEAVQLVGCEIGFLVDPILSEDEKRKILDLNQKDFKYQKFKPFTGDAIFHEGGIPHITFPLYSGRRTNMVIWLNKKK
jgi:hypothetical protein